MQHSVEDFCAATANISLWLRKYFFSGATTTVDTQIATHKFIAALQIGVGGRGNNAEEVMKEEEKEEEEEEEEEEERPTNSRTNSTESSQLFSVFSTSSTRQPSTRQGKQEEAKGGQQLLLHCQQTCERTT